MKKIKLKLFKNKILQSTNKILNDINDLDGFQYLTEEKFKTIEESEEIIKKLRELQLKLNEYFPWI